MHLKPHRYFSMVASTGSFSATARHFQVPASSVSRFIAALEQEVGQQLLYRNTRSVRLTDAGERYHAHIRTVLELLDAADDEIAGDAGTVRGLVRINAPSTFGRLHFSPLVVRLQAQYPELTTELTLTDEYIDPVKDGADIIFRVGHLESSGLIGRLLCEQRYLLCASPDYLKQHGTPKTPEHLREHRCMIHKGNGGTERWYFQATDAARPEMVDVTGPLHSNHSEVLLQAVLAGQGIGLFPTWLLPIDYFAKKALKVVLPQWQAALNNTPRQMFLISPENRLRSRKVRAVWDLLITMIGSPPYWDAHRP